MSDMLRGRLKFSTSRETGDYVRIALVAATVVVGVIQSPRLRAQVTSAKPAAVDESQRNQQPAADARVRRATRGRVRAAARRAGIERTIDDCAAQFFACPHAP